MLGRWNRGSRTSKNWWKRSIWSYLQHHTCHLMSHQRKCKKKCGKLQSAGMVEKELQHDLSTLVRSVKNKSKNESQDEKKKKKTAFCFHNIMQKNRLWGLEAAIKQVRLGQVTKTEGFWKIIKYFRITINTYSFLSHKWDRKSVV